MGTSNKDQLDRWVKQASNAQLRVIENLEKCAAKYEGKADQQYKDVLGMMVVANALLETIDEFYASRM